MGAILILAFFVGALAVLVRAHPRARHPDEVLLVCDSLVSVTLGSPTLGRVLKTSERKGKNAFPKQVRRVEREIGAELTDFFTDGGRQARPVEGPVVLRQLLRTLEDHVPKLPAAESDGGRYLCRGCTREPLLDGKPGVLYRADETGLEYHRVLYGS